ncbi:MAG: hypothetical protein NT007_06900 [Candidatus Kapabacteria bacterium]|nr:hypothetical protein [Candidatus Kapabacteria bacterium]
MSFSQCKSQNKVSVLCVKKEFKVSRKIQLEESEDNVIQNITNFSINFKGQILINEMLIGNFKIYNLNNGKFQYIFEVPKSYSDTASEHFTPWDKDIVPIKIDKLNELYRKKQNQIVDVRQHLSSKFNFSKFVGDTIVSIARLEFPILLQSSKTVKWGNVPLVAIFKIVGKKIVDYFPVEIKPNEQLYNNPSSFEISKKTGLFYLNTYKTDNSRSSDDDFGMNIAYYDQKGKIIGLASKLPKDFIEANLLNSFSNPKMVLDAKDSLYFCYAILNKIFKNNSNNYFTLKNLPGDNSTDFLSFARNPKLLNNTDTLRKLFNLKIFNIGILKNNGNIIVLSNYSQNGKRDYYIQEYSKDGDLYAQMIFPEFSNGETLQTMNYSPEIDKIVLITKSDTGVFVYLLDW